MFQSPATRTRVRRSPWHCKEKKLLLMKTGPNRILEQANAHNQEQSTSSESNEEHTNFFKLSSINDEIEDKFLQLITLHIISSEL